MNVDKNQRGTIVIISGPSGVGKSTICRNVAKRLDNVYISISMTTRPRGKEEVDGRDYIFVSKEEFFNFVKEGKFLEYAEVFGNFYGTPRDKFEQALQQGGIVILEIDTQGARKVKAIYPQALMIFILPPTQRELASRMDSRGRDDAEISNKRLSEADDEIALGWQYYDNMVINDNLQQAVDEIIQIIKNSRILEKQNDRGT